MKKKLSFFLFLLISLVSSAQADLSGAYGYSFKPKGNTGNDKDATGPEGYLVLKRMSGNKYRFWLDVTIGWPSYNKGETDGTITIVKDTASFDNTMEDAEKPCILKFTVKGKTIHINSMSSSFNCGFGNGVNADGDYTWLKNQPTINNAWLKEQYFSSPLMTITSKKAEVFQDENCRRAFVQKLFFAKDDKVLVVAEYEKTVYTEYITPKGVFVWGWIRKTDGKIEEPKQ